MKRPNILIIYTDQQRWDGLGANGNPDIHTPRLDQLAAESVNFDHCFVQNPVCMPSRLSFLTGQYPSTLRVTHMGVPAPEDAVTLPRLLKPYGYRSANIGKLHFQPHANRDHRVPYPAYGFDHLEIADEPGEYEDAYRAWVRKKAPDQLDRISPGLPPMAQVWQRTMGIEDPVVHPEERFPKRPVPFQADEELTFSSFVAEQSIEFMGQQAQAGQPFLCIAGLYSPHSPWVAPQRYFDLYDPGTLTLPSFPSKWPGRRRRSTSDDQELRLARQGYYGQISEVDHHTGRMLDALEELGISQDTVVIFTSDHGEWLGEHLRYGKGYPAHDQCSRVPLLVRAPGVAPPHRDPGLAEAVDVLPTLLDLAGIQVPPHLQGTSLLPRLTGGQASKELALTEHTGWKSVRTERFRYVLHADGREQLYDLAEAWGDYQDLSGDDARAEELARVRHLLARRLLAMERPLPRVWPY